MILQTEHLSKSYGGRTLFHDVTFRLEEYDRLALVGPNGAGKTTLLNIISGEDDPDEGRVLFAKGARVGYLEQEAIEMGDLPVFEEVISSQTEVLEAEQRLHKLEAELGANPTEAQLAAVGRARDAYEMLGELLGMEDRGAELSAYCKNAYDETVSVMAGIPEDQRVRVAYLLGDAGTNTIAKNSYQGQVVDLVANNVADLGKVSGSGSGTEVSLEQVSLWDPELILFQEGSIYDTVGSDPAWADLSAVKSGNYYEVPGAPWYWLNNPPTVNQVLGMQWLPRLLYPDHYDDDMYDTVAGYFKTFYGYDLSESEFNEIAANARPKA